MMTWDDFLQHEEEKEKQRRIKRLAEELEPVKPKAKPVKSPAEKKAEQRALKERIMGDAQKRWEEGCKKKHDLSQPASGPVAWLVFDRATGELYGEATAWRAYQAWAEVNPTKLVHEPGRREPHLVAVGFNACRCVLRSEWEAAEAALRKKRLNGKQNGATRAAESPKGAG